MTGGAAAVIVLVLTGCTGSSGHTAAHTSAPATSAASQAKSAPSNAAQVAAQVCPRVPKAAVNTFVSTVSAKNRTATATGCRAVSNTAAAWGVKGASQPDLLAISVFDRPFSDRCGLSTYGASIQQFSIKSHQAALVSRGSAGGLFLCWASSANRVVLMAVNTPPKVSYASIKAPAVTLATALVDRL